MNNSPKQPTHPATKYARMRILQVTKYCQYRQKYKENVDEDIYEFTTLKIQENESGKWNIKSLVAFERWSEIFEFV